MRCPSCAAENSDIRKFCRECGFRIAVHCRKCGFPNSLDDKYCGGCGIDLSVMESSEASGRAAPGQYSSEDLTELLSDRPQKGEKQARKKTLKETDTVSQDFLDDIFDSDKG